jgi:hypothetical protein
MTSKATGIVQVAPSSRHCSCNNISAWARVSHAGRGETILPDVFPDNKPLTRHQAVTVAGELALVTFDAHSPINRRRQGKAVSVNIVRLAVPIFTPTAKSRIFLCEQIVSDRRKTAISQSMDRQPGTWQATGTYSRDDPPWPVL